MYCMRTVMTVYVYVGCAHIYWSGGLVLDKK